MNTLNKTIRLFLRSIGRRDEYEFYLDRFQAEHSTCFALLCPDAGSIEIGAKILTFNFRFLLRLELTPAILLCGPDAMKMHKTLAAELIFVFRTLGTGKTAPFIEHARNTGKVPVLIAQDMGLETALCRLLPETAGRVHFIRAAGGLKSLSGETLPCIYTGQENFQTLEKMEYNYVALAKKLSEAWPGIHLSVTSPIDLLEEIFTVKGAGTLLRKSSEIRHFRLLKNIDETRLLGLLEASFGKKLNSRAFLENVSHGYIEKDYRGAALLEQHPAGCRYLSKFAVGHEARGKGLAMELWKEICAARHAFFWRSSISNSFNAWYEKQAEGYHTEGQWKIFWRGVPFDRLGGIIEYCGKRGADFY